MFEEKSSATRGGQGALRKKKKKWSSLMSRVSNNVKGRLTGVSMDVGRSLPTETGDLWGSINLSRFFWSNFVYWRYEFTTYLCLRVRKAINFFFKSILNVGSRRTSWSDWHPGVDFSLKTTRRRKEVKD